MKTGYFQLPPLEINHDRIAVYGINRLFFPIHNFIGQIPTITEFKTHTETFTNKSSNVSSTTYFIVKDRSRRTYNQRSIFS